MPQIEVFDPTQGSYTLLGDRYLGSDYHYVTVDLQSYVPQSGGMIVPRYRACPPGHETSFRHDDCLPVGSIELALNWQYLSHLPFSPEFIKPIKSIVFGTWFPVYARLTLTHLYHVVTMVLYVQPEQTNNH